MHIEPGVVNGAKLALGYATAAGSFGLAARLAWHSIGKGGGIASLAIRSAATTALVFGFFQILPHHPVGVSEVHLILGSTLFLIFGAGPAAIGLALGLLAQGLFFAPADLPQYGMNVTSLLAPLYAMSLLARKVIPARVAYKDLTYGQVLSLSTAFQAGVVSWVAFWAFYGRGFGAENIANVLTFGSAYLLVVAIEPLVDLGLLALAKNMPRLQDGMVLNPRLYQPAAG